LDHQILDRHVFLHGSKQFHFRVPALLFAERFFPLGPNPGHDDDDQEC
jgi:hypothetical protein